MRAVQILVVEDEVIVAEDIRRSLERLGYVVSDVVSSGEDAIKKAHETNPDIVLMDIMLDGEMDGIEAAKQIHTHLDIPVVYLTAYSNDSIVERAKVTEPFGYIIKPFKERELHINISIALYKHKIENELKKSREWFITTLKSISDAVITTDSKGYVTFMNPVAESITGWKTEEATGQIFEDVFNIAGDGDDEQSPIKRVNQEGVVVGEADQTVLIARDGKRIQISENGDPIRDDKGNIIGFVIVFREMEEL